MVSLQFFIDIILPAPL